MFPVLQPLFLAILGTFAILPFIASFEASGRSHATTGAHRWVPMFGEDDSVKTLHLTKGRCAFRNSRFIHTSLNFPFSLPEAFHEFHSQGLIPFQRQCLQK
jgi:hypothetical protein